MSRHTHVASSGILSDLFFILLRIFLLDIAQLRAISDVLEWDGVLLDFLSGIGLLVAGLAFDLIVVQKVLR